MASYVYSLGRFLAKPVLSVAEWLRLLQTLFPEVEQRRRQSAELARTFYDDQRALYHPELPRNEMLLEPSTFRAFAQSMDAARPRMSQAESPSDAVANLALRAVRSVENAGRRQIINAVESDPEPRIVKGWARVATGRETCAWCLMLISRGPKYYGADRAGLDLDDESVTALYRKAGLDYEKFFADTEEYMEEWHTGCDCKVVPVFDIENWPGKAEKELAEQIWIDASREAQKLIDSGEARTSNLNKETQNALRRRLYRGEVQMTEFAALAA